MQLPLYHDNFKLSFIPLPQWSTIVAVQFLSSTLVKVRNVHKTADQGLLAQLQKLHFQGSWCKIIYDGETFTRNSRNLGGRYQASSLMSSVVNQKLDFFLNRKWNSEIILDCYLICTGFSCLERVNPNSSFLSLAGIAHPLNHTKYRITRNGVPQGVYWGKRQEPHETGTPVRLGTIFFLILWIRICPCI